MAYTTYPAESATFSSEANALRGELESTKTSLNNANSFFHVDKNEDYLTVKTLEASTKIQAIVTDGCSKLDNDITSVALEADRLEKEEKERQEALLAQNSSSDDTTTDEQ